MSRCAPIGASCRQRCSAGATVVELILKHSILNRRRSNSVAFLDARNDG